MSEITSSKELGFVNIKRIIYLGIPALLLSACATNAEDRSEAASPAERYEYDYLISSRQDNGATWCLNGTPYDSEEAIITSVGKDGVLVSPTNTEIMPLEFTGLSTDSEPLQPANDYTAEILDSYGCDSAEDGDRRVNHF